MSRIIVPANLSVAKTVEQTYSKNIPRILYPDARLFKDEHAKQPIHSELKLIYDKNLS